jgi:hypothetical protein
MSQAHKVVLGVALVFGVFALVTIGTLSMVETRNREKQTAREAKAYTLYIVELPNNRIIHEIPNVIRYAVTGRNIRYVRVGESIFEGLKNVIAVPDNVMFTVTKERPQERRRRK